ncbi:MAG TPA: hypothetical protein VKD26_11770, partial [Streptosporangiaceae bacterium]|nr:hypothetical protein [Streptosporangiaceae bacterium]
MDRTRQPASGAGVGYQGAAAFPDTGHGGTPARPAPWVRRGRSDRELFAIQAGRAPGGLVCAD